MCGCNEAAACVRVPDVEVSVAGLQQLVLDAHRHGARWHLDVGAARAPCLDGAPDAGDAEGRAPGGGATDRGGGAPRAVPPAACRRSRGLRMEASFG
jgi:hypothetical protein